MKQSPITHGKHLFKNVTLLLTVYCLVTCAPSRTDSVVITVVILANSEKQPCCIMQLTDQHFQHNQLTN